VCVVDVLVEIFPQLIVSRAVAIGASSHFTPLAGLQHLDV